MYHGKPGLEGATVPFNSLVGITLTKVEYNDNDEDEVIFYAGDDIVFTMNHWQDCCESVYLSEYDGEFDWLVGSPIVSAEESSNLNTDADGWGGCEEWTFYTVTTQKGTVHLRWNGTSNGYYSTSVTFTVYFPDGLHPGHQGKFEWKDFPSLLMGNIRKHLGIVDTDSGWV